MSRVLSSAFVSTWNTIKFCIKRINSKNPTKTPLPSPPPISLVRQPLHFVQHSLHTTFRQSVPVRNKILHYYRLGAIFSYCRHGCSCLVEKYKCSKNLWQQTVNCYLLSLLQSNKKKIQSYLPFHYTNAFVVVFISYIS